MSCGAAAAICNGVCCPTDCCAGVCCPDRGGNCTVYTRYDNRIETTCLTKGATLSTLSSSTTSTPGYTQPMTRTVELPPGFSLDVSSGSLLVIPPSSRLASSASPSPSHSPSSSSAVKGLSGGAISGIVLGACAAIFIVAGLFFYSRKHRKRDNSEDKTLRKDPYKPTGGRHELSYDDTVVKPAEVDNTEVHELPAAPIEASELHGKDQPVEAEAVSASV